MASYRVSFKRSAEKELYEISQPSLGKIVEAIQGLSRNPRPPGVQLLRGEDRYLRVRQGDYRIVYEVNDTLKQVTVIKVGHRREVYGR